MNQDQISKISHQTHSSIKMNSIVNILFSAYKNKNLSSLLKIWFSILDKLYDIKCERVLLLLNLHVIPQLILTIFYSLYFLSYSLLIKYILYANIIDECKIISINIYIYSTEYTLVSLANLKMYLAWFKDFDLFMKELLASVLCHPIALSLYTC